MLPLLTLHFLAAAVAPALTRPLQRATFPVLALVPAGGFVWLLAQGRPDGTVVDHHPWIGTLGLDVSLALDPLRWVLALLVTGIGALVLVYCASYFRPGDPGLWRFSAVFTAFAGAMLGLVLSDNLLVLYVFWELTTVLSYLLVGHNPERSANRRAAMTALLVTTFGGLAMLVGFILLGEEAGTYSASELVASPPGSGTLVTVAVALILVGAVSKSALIPFHFWLPGAMAAPTPVSAYLHAAAMVKAGIFLVALLAPAYADTPGWRASLVALGVLTMLVGGLRALRQYDVKLLLAYGTVSQLGFLMTLVGLGTRSAALAGLALVLSHALFKAGLFMVVGVVDRSTGTRDLRELTGLHRRMPLLLVVTVLAAGSMAGVPPLLGFVSKESAFAAAEDLGADLGWELAGPLTLAGLALGSVLTVAYAARFVWGTFGPSPGVSSCDVKRPGRWLVAPPAVLAMAGLVLGFLGGPLTRLLEPHAAAFPEGAHEPELTLWHGIGLPLVLSVACLVLGVLLFVARHPVAAAQHAVADRVWLPDAERGYQLTLRGVDRLAIELTGRTQRGSLPFYLGTILLVMVVGPGTALVLAWDDAPVRVADSPAQVVVAVVMAVAAVMTVRSRRRLRAVLLAGISGYGTALLFDLHGAPDLALTQVLVETFVLVTFVLVLRRLPQFFSTRPFTLARWVRVGIGVLSGTVVAGLAYVASGARVAAPVSEGFAKPAKEYGGGSNIVNVTLVDIRAWDTLGELSVLVVAATGIASLIFLITDRATRPTSRSLQASDEDEQAWLRNPSLPADRRSLVFEVVTRLVFHAVIVFSVYLTLVGHELPGGGFAGGLVAGLALMLRYLAGGRRELDAAAPVDAGVVLGVGLALAATSGLLPTLLGGGVLQSAIVDVHIPVLGTLHLVTSVFFDLGVYLVVVGLALDVLRSLGGGIDRDLESERESETEDSEAEEVRP